MSKAAVASIALALTLALVPSLTAQEETQVVGAKSLISREAVRPGETFKAAIILKVQAGYHINDNAPLDEFMIPTALTLEDGPDFEVLEISYPKGRRARFSFAEAELVVYEGEVVLGVLLKAKDGAGAGSKTLKAALGYQACDNDSCLPPKELAFSIAVPVAATAGGADIHPEIFNKLRFRTLQK
jgi:thiol:disulfide interchange protein DsbD